MFAKVAPSGITITNDTRKCSMIIQLLEPRLWGNSGDAVAHAQLQLVSVRMCVCVCVCVRACVCLCVCVCVCVCVVKG